MEKTLADVKKMDKRETLGGTIFSINDYKIRVRRYFDRKAADTSGLTFEEWQPLAVFSQDDKGKKVSIQGGRVKVERHTREEVFWGERSPPQVTSDEIVSVDDDVDGWVKLKSGTKFCNPPTAGDFVINATELREVNFTMEALDRTLPLGEVRRSGRRAAVVGTPPAPWPKVYKLDAQIDHEIRVKCW